MWTYHKLQMIGLSFSHFISQFIHILFILLLFVVRTSVWFEMIFMKSVSSLLSLSLHFYFYLCSISFFSLFSCWFFQNVISTHNRIYVLWMRYSFHVCFFFFCVYCVVYLCTHVILLYEYKFFGSSIQCWMVMLECEEQK